MRAKNDLTYQEYKEGVYSDFAYWRDGEHTPEEVTNWMHEEDNDLFVGSSILLWVLSLAEYELKNNILEDRVKAEVIYYIYRYEMGEYKADYTPEEIEEIEKDIAYIRKNVKFPPYEWVLECRLD